MDLQSTVGDQPLIVDFSEETVGENIHTGKNDGPTIENLRVKNHPTV